MIAPENVYSWQFSMKDLSWKLPIAPVMNQVLDRDTLIRIAIYRESGRYSIKFDIV